MKQQKQFLVYFAFLLKQIVKKPFIWATILAYFLMVLVILLVFPLYQKTSPAQYWNNPVIQISTFLIPVASIFGIMVSMFLFKDGVADGTELIIISKPVSRRVYVIAKFLVLFITCLVFSFLISCSSIIAKINPQFKLQNMKDLMLGLFIGNFINSLFFGSIAIIVSFGLSKNSTIVIVFLATFLINFQTPLSNLFFESPARVLSSSKHSLLDRSFLTKQLDKNGNPTGKNVVFEPNPSKKADKDNIKKIYQEAEAKTFYNQSFYINIGNALNSIYNLNSLSYEKNANVNFLSSNTKIVFDELFNQNEFYNISLFTQMPDEKGLLKLEEYKLFLTTPLPTQSATSFLRIINPPSFSYLEDDNQNYKTETAEFDLYKKYDNNDDLLTKAYQTFYKNVFTSTKNSQQRSILSVLRELATKYLGEITELRKLKPEQLIAKLSPNLVIFNDLLRSPNLMYDFIAEIEKTDNLTNKQKAQKVYRDRINLFYSLSEANNITNIKKFSKYTQAIIDNDQLFNNIPGVDHNANINQNLPDFIRLFLNNFVSDLKIPEISLNDIKLLFYNQLFINYVSLYIGQVINTSSIREQIEGKDKKQPYFVNLYPNAIRKDQLANTYEIRKEPIVNPWVIVIILASVSVALLGISSVLYYSKDYA
ncbi:ABC transporter permease [Mycoplasma bradburyae]|uniref:ABC transporter permease n=1 Tax=Mycoplasma bradburyae TaxID=2963128 RepID=UPI002342549A|nr:ABC transporter permease [Mycoplasma bradburyae]MDC4184448.1 ABC transporter permease [Mycoplasma bradburyae]